MLRLYAFELEFRINGERKTVTVVASTDDRAREDLHRMYPVDVGSVHLICKKPA